jgi:electron transfer flavoprotein beta subunit
LAVAKILAEVVKKHSPDIVIMGKQAIDDDSNATAQMLAGLLEWPQATFAAKLSIADDKKTATVVREIDGGQQTISLPLPCIVSADLRLNEPRYATLPNIMKAKKKSIETLKLDDFKLDIAPKMKIIQVTEPETRSAGVIVKTVDDLAKMIKEKVLQK